MNTKVEVWRSDGEGSVWPDTFAMVGTAEDVEPISFDDKTGENDKVYVYRLRRLDTSTGIYSGWSPEMRFIAPLNGSKPPATPTITAVRRSEDGGVIVVEGI